MTRFFAGTLVGSLTAIGAGLLAIFWGGTRRWS